MSALCCNLCCNLQVERELRGQMKALQGDLTAKVALVESERERAVKGEAELEVMAGKLSAQG